MVEKNNDDVFFAAINCIAAAGKEMGGYLRIDEKDFGKYFLGEGSLSISVYSLLHKPHAPKPSILIGERVSDLNGRTIGSVIDMTISQDRRTVTTLLLRRE